MSNETEQRSGWWIEFKRGWWMRSNPPHQAHTESGEGSSHYSGAVTEEQAKELEKIVSDYLERGVQPPRFTAHGMREFIGRAIVYWKSQPGERAEKEAAEMDAMLAPRPEENAIPEGCTPADAMALREANHHFAEENHQLRRTLRFYAHGEHVVGLKHWEGPSGDDNWLCPPMADFGDYRKQFIDAMDEAMVEDGSLARAALRGKYLDMEGEEELAPVEGEPEWHIEQQAALPSPQKTT